jgi:uncharacterized protein (DUF1697 family)
MAGYAAFLRGMNVGGHRITNDDLKTAFHDIGGFEDVACFRASGNVVFSAAAKESEKKLVERIESGLREALGYEVPVFIRTAAEVTAIAEFAPFSDKELASSKGKVQVSFFPKKPTAAAQKKAESLASDDDRLVFDGRELYWLPKGGVSESEIDMATIVKTFGQSTMRTQGTVQQIVKKYFAS